MRTRKPVKPPTCISLYIIRSLKINYYFDLCCEQGSDLPLPAGLQEVPRQPRRPSNQEILGLSLVAAQEVQVKQYWIIVCILLPNMHQNVIVIYNKYYYIYNLIIYFVWIGPAVGLTQNQWKIYNLLKHQTPGTYFTQR